MSNNPKLDLGETFVGIPLRCRFGWHPWHWWEDAGVAVNPGHSSVLDRGFVFMTQRRICCGCGHMEQRFVGPALQMEVVNMMVQNTVR